MSAASLATSSGKPRFTQVRLLSDNVEAWQAKRDLIASAEASLDLAYFIMDFDDTTSRVALDLVAAAGRGIQVRVLVDHFMTFAQAPALRWLAQTPNIQVRRFGPPKTAWLLALQDAGIDPALFVRGLTTADPAALRQATQNNTILPAAWFEWLKDLQPESNESPLQYAMRVLAAIEDLTKERAAARAADVQAGADPKQMLAAGIARLRTTAVLAMNVVGGLRRYLRRTHHKLLLADRCRFIMGGRNLADAYQRSDTDRKAPPFADVDLSIVDSSGETHEHRDAFAALWSNTYSVDVRQGDGLEDQSVLDTQEIESRAAASDGLPRVPRESLGHCLPDMDGRIVNNLPSSDGGDAAITQAYIAEIRALASGGQPAVIDIVNAYLCPTPTAAVTVTATDAQMPVLQALDDLRDALVSAAQGGVTVRLHTNSPTTTDLTMVNLAAYARLPALIDGGVQVLELEDRQGSLHAKAAAIGDTCIAVGSYNLDPRSILYDTNNLIVLHDPTGTATRTMRAQAIDRLQWKSLSLEEAKRYRDAEPKKALEALPIEILL